LRREALFEIVEAGVKLRPSEEWIGEIAIITRIPRDIAFQK
jgi:hypothetical protein